MTATLMSVADVLALFHEGNLSVFKLAFTLYGAVIPVELIDVEVSNLRAIPYFRFGGGGISLDVSLSKWKTKLIWVLPEGITTKTDGWRTTIPGYEVMQ